LSPSAGFHIIDIEEISPPYPLVAPPSQSVSILKAPVEAPGNVKTSDDKVVNSHSEKYFTHNSLYLVNQKTSNDNSNSNKIVSEIAPVVLQSTPNIQPGKHMKSKEEIHR
jgi:hypothetical protein